LGASIFKESFFGRSGLKSASPSIFEQGFWSLKYSLKLPSFPESFSTCNFLPARIGIPRIDMTWQSGLWNWGVCHQTSKEWI
jgi:hypothetical protein